MQSQGPTLVDKSDPLQPGPWRAHGKPGLDTFSNSSIQLSDLSGSTPTFSSQATDYGSGLGTTPSSSRVSKNGGKPTLTADQEALVQEFLKAYAEHSKSANTATASKTSKSRSASKPKTHPRQRKKHVFKPEDTTDADTDTNGTGLPSLAVSRKEMIDALTKAYKKQGIDFSAPASAATGKEFSYDSNDFFMRHGYGHHNERNAKLFEMYSNPSLYDMDFDLYDPKLNLIGQEQVRSAAEAFQKAHPKLTYIKTGPHRRQWQSADALMQAYIKAYKEGTSSTIPIGLIDEGLREQLSACGTSRHGAKVDTKYWTFMGPEAHRNRDAWDSVSGGESDGRMLARAKVYNKNHAELTQILAEWLRSRESLQSTGEQDTDRREAEHPLVSGVDVSSCQWLGALQQVRTGESTGIGENLRTSNAVIDGARSRHHVAPDGTHTVTAPLTCKGTRFEPELSLQQYREQLAKLGIEDILPGQIGADMSTVHMGRPGTSMVSAAA